MKLQSLRDYFELTDDEGARLRELLPLVRPEFPRLGRLFEDTLLSQRGARQAFGAARQLHRLGRTFLVWLEQLLAGPWDQAYFERRSREGRFLARIGLAQHHVVTALDAVRIELAACARDTADPLLCRAALDKALDFDMAIMAGAQREEELLARAQTERATTMGLLVGTMCHELRNPLSVMESSVFLLQGQLGDDPRVQKHLDRISQQIGLAERRIGGMLDLIRDRPLRARRLELSEVLGPAVAQAAVPAWIRVTLEGPEDAPEIAGDLKRLLELFGQLLQNALQAIGESAGEIRITSRRGPDQDILVSVADSGPGVPAWLLPKLFEPLVTSHTGQLGLGLAQVRRIAELHRGRVEYHPGPPHRFTVSLPLA